MKSQVFSKLWCYTDKERFPKICDKTVFDSDEYWESLVRHYTVTVYHPPSTCRMGAISDSTSVVDSKLR